MNTLARPARPLLRPQRRPSPSLTGFEVMRWMRRLETWFEALPEPTDRHRMGSWMRVR